MARDCLSFGEHAARVSVALFLAYLIVRAIV
jgi:hypothetical protein